MTARGWRPGPIDLVCLAIAGGLLAGHRLFTLDTWWHLSLGVETLELGRIPAQDSLSWTAPGAALSSHAWLFDLLLGLLHRVGGLGLVEVGGALGVALVLRLSAHAARALGASGSAALLVPPALLLSASQFLDLRPQLASYAGLAWLLAAYGDLRAGRPGPLRWSPLALVLWSNLHGGFLLGLLFLGGLAGLERGLSRWGDPAAQDRSRALLQALLLGLVAVCVHPHGPGQFLDALENTPLGSPWHLTIDEWRPPPLERVPALRGWVLLALALALTHPGRPPLFEALGLLAGLFLAFSAWRNLPLLAVAGGAILATWLTRVAGALLRRAPRPGLARLEALAGAGGLSGGAALILAAALLAGGLELRRPTDVEATPRIAGAFPVAAARWVREHALQGPLLNSYAMGGYLGWVLRGRHRVAIDSRMAPFYEFYGRTWARIWTGHPAWREALRESGAEWALLERGPSAAPALALLRTEPAWRAVYADPVAVVVVRAEGPNRDLPALAPGSW